MDNASKDNVPLFDVNQFSYFKVLSNGILSKNQPAMVKAKLVSTEKKIKEASGVVAA